MKKSLLSSAVAIAVASTAHATSYNVTTNITGVQVWMNHIDVKIDCPYPVLPDPIDIDGTAEGSSPTQIDSANLSIGGTVCLDLGAGLVARLVFALSNGQYSASAPGTTFTGGSIGMDILTTTGWVPYTTIDASVSNLPFIANQTGHLGTTGSPPANINTTAGLLLSPGTNPLPGFWTGDLNGPGMNSAIGVIWPGSPLGLYVSGSISLTP